MNKPNYLRTNTFTADIYMGANKGHTKERVNELEVRSWIQQYVDTEYIAVSFTHLSYHYPLGNEDGYKIGIINYPRYPRCITELKHHSLSLAILLKRRFEQDRVTVVFPDETITIEEIST